jgi:UDP-N-acetylmuramyl pentapeptide synthase
VVPAALGYADAFQGELLPVASPEEAAALLEEVARPGDRVLVKGSRSAGLERVLANS